MIPFGELMFACCAVMFTGFMMWLDCKISTWWEKRRFRKAKEKFLKDFSEGRDPGKAPWYRHYDGRRRVDIECLLKTREVKRQVKAMQMYFQK